MAECLFRNFVEGNTGRRGRIEAQDVAGVPGDCLAFAVVVRAKIDLGPCSSLLQTRDGISLCLDGFVAGGPGLCWTLGSIEADGCQILFKSADVAHGGLDAPTGTEESLNLLALCRRFNDQELHRTVSDTCGVRVTFAYFTCVSISTPVALTRRKLNDIS